ncbi:MAG: PLP-dependent aminotransferase family protein [Lachnospiraceae bacterium]|nr:PLP-dependent aminotransferase family protein [Lachnospiraceae bacterium]
MLTISIDTKKKQPIYEQIYIFIRQEIRAGALVPGSRLPSSRKLAAHLDVSRNTVDLAYGQLLSEGYIESKPKRGYFVSSLDELFELNLEVREEVAEEIEEEIRYPYDFSPSGVDMGMFPYNTWRKLMKEVLMDDNSEVFQKGDPKGDLSLRSAVRDYLHQSRGVNCHTSQIIIGSGMEYLLLLLAMILGKTMPVGMENPTYLQSYKVFEKLGYPVTAISMDEGGIVVDELDKSGAELAYVTPAHQYPTGIIMPVRRRHALLKWAKEMDGRYILEDDYDSEFRYQGKPIPSLQGSDHHGKVIYMGTFSKAIAPAIRVSYMVLPKKLLSIYEEQLSFFSCTVSRIDQMVLGNFLKEGHFERHLNRMRAIYKAKVTSLLGELKLFGDDVIISGASAGLHVLITLPKLSRFELFLEMLLKRGVRIYPISGYYIEGTPDKEHFILGFARLSDAQIREGIQIMKEVYDEILNESK